MSINMKMVAS